MKIKVQKSRTQKYLPTNIFILWTLFSPYKAALLNSSIPSSTIELTEQTTSCNMKIGELIVGEHCAYIVELGHYAFMKQRCVWRVSHNIRVFVRACVFLDIMEWNSTRLRTVVKVENYFLSGSFVCLFLLEKSEDTFYTIWHSNFKHRRSQSYLGLLNSSIIR